VYREGRLPKRLSSTPQNNQTNNIESLVIYNLITKDQKMSLKLAGRLKYYRQELPVQLSVSADFEINRN
jgi:hypothetical protein